MEKPFEAPMQLNVIGDGMQPGTEVIHTVLNLGFLELMPSWLRSLKSNQFITPFMDLIFAPMSVQYIAKAINYFSSL